MKRVVVSLFILLCISIQIESAPFKRHVLGLYNSEEGKTLTDNPLRIYVEMPLNYLGLKLEYHDLANGLPDPNMMHRYRGVIAWLDEDRLTQARAYWHWIEDQLKASRQMVLLTGAFPTKDRQTNQRVPTYLINRVLGHMGLQKGTDKTDLALDIEWVSRQSNMVEFERTLESELVQFSEMTSIGANNQVLLQLRMRSTQAISDAVVITPNGGLVMPGYLHYVDTDTRKHQWRINPFAFFAQTLQVIDTPRLDCTTQNGTRLAYSHIDGDGIANMSVIKRKLSGEIIRDEIIKKYPNLPFTVSVIVWEIIQQSGFQERIWATARSLFRLPNVEPASHTFSHPLVWNLGAVDSTQIDYYNEVMPNTFIRGRALIPWDIEGYIFDPVKETTWSCQFIENELLPDGQKCDILLWSGNTLPDEETLATSAQGGLMNMNGGDARLDGEYPSYSYVTPLYRQVGNQFQIHSSNSNENTYTNLWTGPFGGFQNVIQTFENTETPRRVAPINIYYHFYSGERPAGLLALQRVYEWVQTQNVSHIFASQYIKIVQGFIQAEIEAVEDQVWRIHNNGHNRTVRFDLPNTYPDLKRSSGIMGFSHHQNSLYVFLDKQETSTIALTSTPPNDIHLNQANVQVSKVTQTPNGNLSFLAQGLGEGAFIWYNLAPLTAYTVEIKKGNNNQKTTVQTDAKGKLMFDTLINGEAHIRISKQNRTG